MLVVLLTKAQLTLNARPSPNNVTQMEQHFVLILELVQHTKQPKIVLEKVVVVAQALVFGIHPAENKSVLKQILPSTQMLNVITS